MDNRKQYLTYFFVLVGLAFFVFLLYYFGVRALWEAIRSASPLPLGLCVAVLLAGLWVRAWKWHYALGSGQQGVGLFFMAKMAGSWTPGRAGEFAPLLLKEHRTVAVTMWIVTDRVLEVWMTLAVGIWGAWYMGITPGQTGLALLAGGGVATLVLLLLVWRRDWIQGLETRWAATPLVGRCLSILSALHEEVRALRNKTFPIVVSTIFAKWTDLFVVILLCKAFGFNIQLALAGAVRCAHALVSAIPVTPDVSGAPYVAQAVLLHEYAAMPYEVLAAALALEAVMVYGVLYFSYMISSRKYSL